PELLADSIRKLLGRLVAGFGLFSNLAAMLIGTSTKDYFVAPRPGIPRQHVRHDQLQRKSNMRLSIYIGNRSGDVVVHTLLKVYLFSVMGGNQREMKYLCSPLGHHQLHHLA